MAGLEFDSFCEVCYIGTMVDKAGNVFFLVHRGLFLHRFDTLFTRVLYIGLL